jgi:apolipoprotein N-acyltransferase
MGLTRGLLMSSCLFGGAAAVFLIGGIWVHGSLSWGVGVCLMLAALRAQAWWRGCLFGAIFATLVAVGGNVPWASQAGMHYFGLPPRTALVAAGLLGVACGIVFGVVLGLGLWCATRVARCWVPLLVGAAWAAWESLVSSVFPYYPWAPLAATQLDLLAVAQLASLLGAPALSFLVVACGAALAGGLEAGPVLRRGTWGGAAFASMAVGLYGAARLGTGNIGSEGSCRIAAIDVGMSAAGLRADEILGRYEHATAGIGEWQPDIVAWPESALPGYPELDVELRQRLRAAAARWQTHLIAGGPRVGWSREWRRRLFNSVYGIPASGALDFYDKRVLVPFAEYWPGPSGLRPAWWAADEVEEGTDTVVFVAGDCRIGPLVCFESSQSKLARQAVTAGAEALLIVSNDAYLSPEAIARELAQARLRAIETGVPVVRAANAGHSALIDRYGRIVESGTAGVLKSQLPPGKPAPAIRTGFWFLLLCSALTLAGLAGALRGRSLRP